MGRSYWFECSRCGYRAVVSGKAARGPDFYVQTISCADCKKLYDAVTRLRVPAGPIYKPPGVKLDRTIARPPSFEAALSRLPAMGITGHRWKTFKPLCPVSPSHRVQTWADPGACPKCGLAMEKNPLPFRIWE